MTEPKPFTDAVIEAMKRYRKIWKGYPCYPCLRHPEEILAEIERRIRLSNPSEGYGDD
jgi:hypothetical protein